MYGPNIEDTPIHIKANPEKHTYSNIGSIRGSPNGTIGNFTNGTIGLPMVPIVPLGEPMVPLALPSVQMVLPMVPLVKP